MNKRERRVKIYDLVYREFLEGFPLKSAQDLSCTLNLRYLGLGLSSTGATGACIKLKNEGLLVKRKIYGGIRPLKRYFYWGGEKIAFPHRTYWYLRDRKDEVFPMRKEKYLEQVK